MVIFYCLIIYYCFLWYFLDSIQKYPNGVFLIIEICL
jgi:hypothetical protein